MDLLLSYNLQGKKYSFSDVITQLSPRDTPFISSTGKHATFQTKFFWQTDTLDVIRDNAWNVDEYPDMQIRPTTENVNVTQILRKVEKVTFTANEIDTYGRQKEIDYRMKNAAASIKRDLETIFLSGQEMDEGTTSGKRKTAGFKAQVAHVDEVDPVTGAIVHKKLDSEQFTEQDIFDITYNLYMAGSRANVIMYNPDPNVTDVFAAMMHNKIGRLRVFRNAEQELKEYVDVIVDPLGQKYMLVPNRFMPLGHIYFFHPHDWFQRVLREPKWTKLDADGSYIKMMLEMEVGLQHRNRFASGILEFNRPPKILDDIRVDAPYPFWVDDTFDISDHLPGGLNITNWKSENEVFATVDENGVVTALRPGQTLITGEATTFRGDIIKVYADFMVKRHREVTLVQPKPLANNQKYYLLSWTVTDEGYSTVEFTTDEDYAFSVVPDSENVLGRPGLILRKRAGTQKVTMVVTYPDGEQFVRQIDVTVAGYVPIVYEVPFDDGTLGFVTRHMIEYIAHPSEDIPGDKTQKHIEHTIITDDAELNVQSAPITIPYHYVYIPLNPYIPVGATVSMDAGFIGGTIWDTITFKSRDENIATVDAQGNVTVHAEGETIIDVLALWPDGYDATEVIVIGQIPHYDFNINPVPVLTVGDDYQLTSDHPVPNDVEWETSDSHIARVAVDGWVVADNPGTVTITATGYFQYGKVVKTTTLTVRPAPKVYTITLDDPGTLNKAEGKTTKLKVNAPAGATLITYTSSNESVLEIGSDGMMNPVGVGSSTVSVDVEYLDGRGHAEIEIHVIDQVIDLEDFFLTSGEIVVKQGTKTDLMTYIRAIPSNATVKPVFSTSNSKVGLTIGSVFSAMNFGTTIMTITDATSKKSHDMIVHVR